jgi:RNA polymerase sigma-70 factor (ECF subfamily)
MLRRDPLANLEPLIKRVYAYVAYRVGDGADAEDITSSTFERALRYRASFDPKRGEPVSWLIGIARREISAHFGGAEDVTGEVPETVAPGDLAADSATRLDLQAAVAALDRRDRELVALRYGADLTARQIAELLELQTNAVEVALHRALRRLRDRMTGPSAPPVPEPRLSSEGYPSSA